jgi:hypothetical protein
MVATDLGGYLHRVARVRPGIGGRKPLVKAAVRVDSAGEKSAAWDKATRAWEWRNPPS